MCRVLKVRWQTLSMYLFLFVIFFGGRMFERQKQRWIRRGAAWCVLVLWCVVSMWACDTLAPSESAQENTQETKQEGTQNNEGTGENTPTESSNEPAPTETTTTEKTEEGRPETNEPHSPDGSTETTPDGSTEPTPEQNSEANPPEQTADQPTQPTGCGVTTFRYDAKGQTPVTVFVAGSFNSWADSVAKGAYAMVNTQGSLWEVTQKLPEGTHQYKFVVDGKWIPDPDNPRTAPDGFGGQNSIIEIAPCTDPTVEVTSHKTTNSDFTADLLFKSGASGSGVSKVIATLDHQAAPAGSVTHSGNTIKVDLKGLAKGIHDLRVEVEDQNGQRSAVKLLKIYVGFSTDWRDVSLYFAMIDRFLDGDPANNKPFADTPDLLNYMGGDFKGLSQKIDSGYFDALGINALWITWPIDNPDYAEPGARPGSHWCNMNSKDPNIQWIQTRYSGYHGYWPVDTNKVEEHFGTLQDLQDLVVKAHKRGIRILLDFTVNHLHKESPIYKQHANSGYFNTPAEICDNVGWDNKPVTCWFVDYLPDINYNNTAISKIMLDHVVDWVKKTGADGLRVDALKHIEQGFIRQLRQRTAKEFESTGVDFYMVGETFTGDTGLIKKYIANDQVHGQFDFPLNLQILKAFARNEIGLDSFDQAARGIMASYGSDALMSTFIGNHDIARFVSMAGGQIRCGIWDVISNRAQSWNGPPTAPTSEDAYKKLLLAFAYIFALPGIPLVYYGDEFGLPGAGDPDNRRMMRFDSQLSAFEKNTLAMMQKIGKARQQYEALRRGALGSTLQASSDHLVFLRTGQGGPAVIILNRGGQRTVTLSASALGVSDGTVFENALAGGQITVSGGNLTIPVNPITPVFLIKK